MRKSVLLIAVPALGQRVSLVLDGYDTPHLVLYEITSNSPLDGTIAYLTRP